MATPSNHWKLGLFVVLGVALALTCLLVLAFGPGVFSLDYLLARKFGANRGADGGGAAIR